MPDELYPGSLNSQGIIAMFIHRHHLLWCVVCLFYSINHSINHIFQNYPEDKASLDHHLTSDTGSAKLETTGYGLVALIQSRGDISVLEQILLIRGLLSPAAHAAWTGFVCAVMWRERERKEHGLLSPSVIGAFILAIVLHTLWDTVNSLGGTAPGGLILLFSAT